MPLSVYTPNDRQIIHYTSVDFSSRPISEPVHLVQYDDTLPILSVSLFKNGQPYILPRTANANIRWGKLDGTFVYNPALGTNSDRSILYFTITIQMVTGFGECHPIVEIEDDTEVAGSASIRVIIDRNPIQHGSIESSVEYQTGQMFAKRAEESAQRAAVSEKNAKVSENEAKNAATRAATSEQNAKNSETAAAQSATNAKKSENNAAAIFDDIKKFTDLIQARISELEDHAILDSEYTQPILGDDDGYQMIDKTFDEVCDEVVVRMGDRLSNINKALDDLNDQLTALNNSMVKMENSLTQTINKINEDLNAKIRRINTSLPYQISYDGTTMNINDEQR